MAIHLLVTGATGMVGAEVIRQAIADPEVNQITALVRRPLEIASPKLKTIIHENYQDYTGLEVLFQSVDACIWCLGISQTQVTKDEYIKITYTYTIAAAKALLAANNKIRFVFLSGAGADSSEKSSTLFAREKGRTENALLKCGFKTLFLARPGGIKPMHKLVNPALPNRIFPFLYPLMNLLVPNLVITATQLAVALIWLAKDGSNNGIYENAELLKIAKGFRN